LFLFSPVFAQTQTDPLIKPFSEDLDVMVYEFEIKPTGSVHPGVRNIRVSNVGTITHELVVFRLHPGKTVNDFLSNFKAGRSLSASGRTIANMHPLNKGEVGVFTANFETGNYILLCFMVDTETGKPHFLLGMNHQFLVD
jgi:hypothetical protein